MSDDPAMRSICGCWECLFKNAEREVAERDATIARLTAELSEWREKYQVQGLVVSGFAIKEREARADLAALRAKVEEARTAIHRDSENHNPSDARECPWCELLAILAPEGPQ